MADQAIPTQALPPGPLMLDLQGLTLQPDEASLLVQPQVGGVIFFSRNVESAEQLLALVEQIRAVRPDLLLAVDQEGGRVQRLKEGFTRLPPMQAFLADFRRDPEQTATLVKDVGWLMAAEVIATGIDFSFAPVLDVDDSHCSVIADRAFSPDPHEVATLAGQFITGMHEAGMAATGKHFPGHGQVQADSHLELPIDQRGYAEVKAHDLIPFAALLPQLDAVMPAHILFPQIDAQPVGFSAKWLQQTLRGELGFDGVIFSDDLSMAGAHCGGNYGSRAELALRAGCDMVLVCNNRTGAEEVLQHFVSLALPVSPRLSRMAAKRRWEWGNLIKETRWQVTRDKLMALMSEAALAKY